ncbi:MAG: M20/M25/M40 family metallo-hydrolase, partial [Candidatus Bathyarchaeia archaeon]
GDFIEIAEKSLLWFKIHTMGKQVHASLPNKGLNAHRVGITVAIALDRLLHKKYSKRDRCFDVPESTFEITKKERNVDAVNIIPGEDTVYFDCRILPRYNVDEVLKDIGDVVLSFEKKTGAKITVEVLQKQASPMVNPHHKAVKLLKRAIKKTKPVPIKVGGIGGGTCAAFFRQVGIPALVWSTIDGVAHQPNEYSKVDNMVNDAKVFALLAIS